MVAVRKAKAELKARAKRAVSRARSARQGRAKGQAAHPLRGWETGLARVADLIISAGGGNAGAAGNLIGRLLNR